MGVVYRKTLSENKIKNYYAFIATSNANKTSSLMRESACKPNKFSLALEAPRFSCFALDSVVFR